jgi:NADH-ubiquinone oxidoreductase chain 4
MFLLLNSKYPFSLTVLIFLQSVITLLFFNFGANSYFLLLVLFELSMFPILFIILGFGSQVEKISASYYIILYTLLARLPLLLMLSYLGFSNEVNTWNLNLSSSMKLFLLLAFLAKFPIYSLHLWLPKAHVEASTEGSILLARILLKVGSIGYLFLLIDSYILLWLSLIGMSVGRVLTLIQSDTKAMIGYSSAVHMSCILLGLNLNSYSSRLGGVVTIASHGFVSASLFFLVGSIYHQVNSRIIYLIGRVYSSSIFLSLLVSISFLGNIAIPPMLSFLGEISILSSSIVLIRFFMLFVSMYLILRFYYSIFLLVRLLFGKFISLRGMAPRLSSSIMLMNFVLLPILYLC